MPDGGPPIVDELVAFVTISNVYPAARTGVDTGVEGGVTDVNTAKDTAPRVRPALRRSIDEYLKSGMAAEVPVNNQPTPLDDKLTRPGLMAMTRGENRWFVPHTPSHIFSPSAMHSPYYHEVHMFCHH